VTDPDVDRSIDYMTDYLAEREATKGDE